jgi:hypothetical protein
MFTKLSKYSIYMYIESLLSTHWTVVWVSGNKPWIILCMYLRITFTIRLMLSIWNRLWSWTLQIYKASSDGWTFWILSRQLLVAGLSNWYLNEFFVSVSVEIGIVMFVLKFWTSHCTCRTNKWVTNVQFNRQLLLILSSSPLLLKRFHLIIKITDDDDDDNDDDNDNDNYNNSVYFIQ